MSAIFRFSVAIGRASSNPAAPLAGAMNSAPRQQHRAALKVDQQPDFFKALEAYRGHPATAQGLKIVARVPANEVRCAYNVALYLDELRKMMEWHSDFLDKKADLRSCHRLITRPARQKKCAHSLFRNGPSFIDRTYSHLEIRFKKGGSVAQISLR